MADISAVGVAAAALIITIVAGSAWRYVQASRREVRRLQQRIAALEQERAARPSPRAAFEYKGATREALLHVTNDGGDTAIRAPMSVEGALAHHLAGAVSAAWQDDGSTIVLRRGETRTLRLAKLDLSVFPYAQWEIYGIGQGGETFAVRAMHTSTIGGDPDTHAPALFIQIALVCSPDSASAPVHCTIALQPFEAVRLRPF